MLSPLKMQAGFFDKNVRQYVQIRGAQKIAYTMEKNLSIPEKFDRVARSQVILKTQSAILEANGYVRDKRNFKAIAVLLEQQKQLEEYADKLHDRELARDANVMHQFVNKLQKFDDAWFQSIQIWRDMSWDNDRFAGNYQ